MEEKIKLSHSGSPFNRGAEGVSNADKEEPLDQETVKMINNRVHTSAPSEQVHKSTVVRRVNEWIYGNFLTEE